MLRKLLFSLVLVLFGVTVHAQNGGALKVTVTDAKTKESLPFTPVVVLQGNQQIASGQTDINGDVILKPLAAGKYEVKAQIVGYLTKQISGVIVSDGKTNYVIIEMAVATTNLEAVEVVSYREPLIDPDTKSGSTVTREEFLAMPSKNLNSVAATTAGVYQQDEGGDLNVRGGRSDATAYYVDGQKVIGSAGVPQQGVEQVTVITGGVPAMYGDLTGGVISVTTRGPMPKFFGGIEAISSQLTDQYGYNFLGFSVGGPILMKKDSATGTKKPMLGFILSGEGYKDKDPDPSAVGVWKVKDDKLKELEQNPLRLSKTGQGFDKNAELITKDDMEHIKYRQNVRSNVLRLNLKLDFKPTDNTNFTLGGSMDYSNYHDFQYRYSLFNPKNNPQVIKNTWRVFGRINQRFGVTKDNEKSQSTIKNAYFSLQAEYENTTQTTQDDSHQDRLFNYGYIGKFTQYKAPSYNTYTTRTINGKPVTGYFQDGFRDTLLTFQASDINKEAARYTQEYYELYGGKVVNADQVRSGLGLINGDRPSNVTPYSLFYNTGRQFNDYYNNYNSKFRVFSTFSADVKNHAIQVGFEYDQRAYRFWDIQPMGLWGLMSQITNSHIAQLDTANPILNTALSGTNLYYDYNRKVDYASQTYFDKSLRKKLGVADNQWIDVNSYAPSTYSLDMFSPDDLLNHGNAYLSPGGPIAYMGYTAYGKKLKGTPSFDDYFNKKDANGNYSRLMAPFQPIYVAGFIQDKFDYKNIKFNVGVRIDRYDANQKVLKDKYSLYETVKAGEVDYAKFDASSTPRRPDNIGNDYVVYVDKIKDPTKIVGYRQENTWYDAQGNEVQNPDDIAKLTSDGSIKPFLVDQDAKQLSPKAFKDYVPQVNVMPRIAFSFPISDVANFFAHYDVLTQRPNVPSPRYSTSHTGTFTYLPDYLFIQQNVANGNAINNPDLKPTRTTDYELGFQQVLSEKKNASITITAFYREQRNMIQVIKVNQAYPISYLTYGNVDFGTIKGFSATYDLRRIKGVQMTANYTLQFADATGSGASSGYNIANGTTPNLRVYVPTTFDQRHNIVINTDYRFGAGTDYRGPVWTKKSGATQKTIQLLKNIGANLKISAGSGTPYTKQMNPVSLVAGRSALKGSVNGSNLPWQFRMDLRVDKNIELSWKNKKEEGGRKMANLNIYVTVFNLLNRQNIVDVYRYTGNPGDDGYLNAAIAQPIINSAVSSQAYKDQYGIYANDPANYSIPRRIRIGFALDF